MSDVATKYNALILLENKLLEYLLSDFEKNAIERLLATKNTDDLTRLIVKNEIETLRKIKQTLLNIAESE